MSLIHYSASIQDHFSVRRTVDAFLDPADLTGEPAGFLAWLTTLDTIIDGVIVAAQIRVTPPLPTTLLTTSRTGFGTSKVSQNGVVRFNLTGTSKHYSQAIPAIAEANVSAGKLNLTAISAYTSLMTGNTFTDDTGASAITTVYGGFVADRTNRKQLQSKSFSAP